MVDIQAFKNDVSEEVSTILASDFVINLTSTNTVPHSDDAAITFPNLDGGSQGVKVVETAVLYVDMRRSTQLSLRHHPHTVTKLYSAFVRAMTRSAKVFSGEVRGIIGDRVMMLFDTDECYANAVYTAILINSVCRYVINKNFPYEEVSFGIGIDHGRMLATKTGIRRHGSAQQSYRSLVWLGRPANVASKLTDNANKPEEAREFVKLRVGYDYLNNGTPPLYQDEWPEDFVQRFTYDQARGAMVAPNFHSFTVMKNRIVINPSSPPILMSKRVYDGFKATRPFAPEIQNGWFSKVNRSIPDVPDEVFGGDVIYSTFAA
jgi:class 3 adenylate cyclase